MGYSNYSDKGRKQYFAMVNALTKAEKDLIAIYEFHWHMGRFVPTIEQVVKELKKKHPKATQVSVNHYLSSVRPVGKALDKRGIPWRQHSQEELTATQVAAGIVIMNVADDRPTQVKLDALGINPETYYAWLKDPKFKAYIASQSQESLENVDPIAKMEFLKKVHAGDWQAVKYYLDNTGALLSNEQPQSEELIKMLIEIIQTHVRDSETITAIAQDIKRASANRTLEVAIQQPALTGEIVDEEELSLEEAKKKLGI